jgi:hypothetical protein
MIAGMRLSGPHYQQDNKAVYALLLQLTMGGPGQVVIAPFRGKTDGRGAWKALLMRMEGQAYTKTRIATAQAQLHNTTFSGERKQFTFDSYIAVHQEAHNTLSECGVPLYDCMKVNLFLDHITDETLDAAKHQILSNDEKYAEDFDAVVTFLVSALSRRKSAAKASRAISSATSKGKENKGQRKPGGKNKGPWTGPVSGDITYKKHEWVRLSSAQQAEVRRQRDAARGKAGSGGGGGTKQAKRAAAAANSSRDGKSPGTDGDRSDSGSESDAGSEAPFGRRAHKGGGKRSKKGGGASS